MIDSWGPILLLVLGGLDFAILLGIVIVRRRSRRRTQRQTWVREFMQIAFPSAPVSAVVSALHRDSDAFLHEYMDLADSIELPAEQEEKLQRALVEARRFPALVRDLRSRRASRRRRAALWLSFALPEHAVRPLIAGLERERSRSVRLHMAHALVRLGEPAVIPTIVDTLCDSDSEYQRQIYGLLAQFGTDLHGYFEVLQHRREPEIRRMLAQVAADRGDDTGRQYLIELTRSEDRPLAIDATHALIRAYVHTLDIETMLASSDRMVANLTIEALGKLSPQRSLEPLLRATTVPETRKSAIVGLSRLVRDRPQTYSLLIDELLGTESSADENALMEVISNRVEYLIERVLREPDSPQCMLLDRLVRSNRASGVLGFLNRNRDAATERLLTETVARAIRETPEAQSLFAAHAKPSVLDRLGLVRTEARQQRGARVSESVRPLFIVAIIFVTVALPFATYIGVRGIRAMDTSVLFDPGWFIDYVRSFTLAFGVYAFALNLIYLSLLLFASFSVRAQQQTLEIKPLSMLFSAEMLPSISIIAPAYNEESTIVESVNSLLNIRYPDFEIIVVNDGSPDGTLDELITRFELERTDIFLHGYLETQPVRAVYRNPRIPELTVIDKQNGGKADSLNSGINASRKDYFAAIDSDSLLERDSLLRLAARFLDSDVPVVASGGNIFPVNGCTVSHGKLDRIRLPDSLLGRFQTLEYIRAFMAGRTGWAAIDSLMIISGAFGLFRKQEVIDAHGYLTGSGYYSKDTVAEDMELVVRVARMLRERKKPFTVQYGYNANCWTEVPTTHRILASQRDRWQRGLIDTMIYHRRMLGNPRYGRMGTIGFPYFFLFELLGPWIEIQGLVFLILGLILGIMPFGIVMIVLAATIPLGIAVSLSSLLLAEYHQSYFSPRERLVLIGLSFLENFGYRQYAGLLRLRGYISALGRKTGWGSMVRTGFSSTGSPEKEGTA